MSKWNGVLLIKLIVAYMVVQVAVFGLTSHIYVMQRKKFQISYIMLGYSLVVIAAFTLIYTNEIFNDTLNGNFDLRDAVKLYSYMNIIAAIVSFMNTLLLANAMVSFLNNVQLFDIIVFFKMQQDFVKSSVLRVALKAIVIPFVIELTLIMRQMRNDPDRPLLWTIYTFFPAVISNIMPNCFFGTLVVSRMLFESLNKNLLEIVKEVNFLQTELQMRLQKSYYRMQRFCELADKLDVLAEKYALIHAQTLEYLQLISLPFLCSLLCNLFGITAGFFTQYLAIADTLINKQQYDIFDILTNSIFLITSFSEIILQANICNDNLIAVQKMGQILQRATLTHADVRFKQSVEAFSLQLLVKRYKVQPLGLLEVNVSLVHDVTSAVTSFLLILIQSDLTLRFSLS